MISDAQDTPLINETLCPTPFCTVARPTKIVKSKPSFRVYVNFNLYSQNINFSKDSIGLMDTGASCSLIAINQLPEDIANKLTPRSGPVKGIGGSQNILGTFKCKVHIGDAFFTNVEFLVVEDLPRGAQVILGTNIILHPNIISFAIDKSANEIHFTFRGRNLGDYKRKCKYLKDANYLDNEVKCKIAQTKEPKETFSNLREKLEFLAKHEIILSHSNEEYLEKFANLLIANISVFGKEGELGCFPTPVAIETQGDPVNIRQHEIAQKFQPFVDAEIKKMLKTGVIRKCKDPKGWNSPILCVAKKDGSVRVCANFKNTLNKRLCRPDPFPAPAIEEVFNSIEDGNDLFSSLDLQSGYWQLKIREEDKHKTAFTWQGETLEFERVPFGWTASGAAFCRVVATAFNSVDFDKKKVLSYIDDIAILGKNIDRFIANHQKVFDALKSFNLRLKPRKCYFLKSEIPFLGRYLSAQGTRPIPEYVDGIMNIQAPSSMKELKQLQGRLTWIKAFIGTRMGEMLKTTSFSHLIEPILETSRQKPFKWTKEADNALAKIKLRMTKPPFISFSDPSLPYVLITDASDTALGGILCQKKGEHTRIIGTVSKCFSPTERRWSTTEREAYSILFCVKKFSYFLARNHFTVFTDHKSLTYMDRRNFNNSKICRWQDELSNYSFHVQYVEGEENVWADWLSRPFSKVANNDIPEDFTPAGRFINIEGTKIQIYVPSWVTDKLDPNLEKLRFKNSNKDILCDLAFDTSQNDTDPKCMLGQNFDFEPIFDTDHKIESAAHPMALAALVAERDIPENPQLFQYLDIAKQQRDDPYFAKIISRIESPEPLLEGQLVEFMNDHDHRSDWFKKFANNLFVEPMTRLLMMRDTKTQKFIVPDSMRKQMLKSAHDNMGHCGKERVLEHLSSMAWPGKTKDVIDYVRSCDHCSQIKGNYGKRPPKPGHNLRGSTANEVLYLDYIFLEKVKNGFRYALTIIDSFTRFVSVYPSRHNRACDTARFLYDYVIRHGRIPSIISTDRGSHFVGQVMKEFCKHLGIKHNIHCAYRPQSTGILERSHRTLKNSLKIVAKELNKPWPEVLNQVVAAMNACHNSATKCSPFYAMYGKNYCLDIPRLPKDDPKCFDALTHGMNLNAAMIKIHRLVELCAAESDFRKDLSLREVNVEKLNQGDKVLIYRPLSAEANSPVGWKEGYTVLDGKSNNFSAKLKNDANGKTDWVHRSQIRKLYPRPPHLNDDSDDECDLQPIITKLCENSDVDKSSSGGVECISNISKSDIANDTIKVEADDSICSNQSQRQVVDENQLASLFKNIAGKRKTKKKKLPTEPLRKSNRVRKSVEKLQVGSTKGKSYD